MDFDDLTEKEELAMACAADDIERNHRVNSSEAIKGAGDRTDVSKSLDRATDADKGTAKLGETESTSQFSLHFKKGDLFLCPPSDSLAHCVSKDLRMGKGIAVLFKQKFAGISELKQQANSVGNVAILKRDDRYIYYLITKPKYNDKPTYQTLETTLRGMKCHCVKFGVKRLSMPRIGCGLDKLVWSQVENMLRKVFSDTDMTITIYSI